MENQKEIITSIQILNGLVKNNFLKVKVSPINTIKLCNQIKNKKLLEIANIYDNSDNFKKYSTSDSPGIDTDTPKTVTNFSVPSFVYKETKI